MFLPLTIYKRRVSMYIRQTGLDFCVSEAEAHANAQGQAAALATALAKASFQAASCGIQSQLPTFPSITGFPGGGRKLLL